MMSTAARETRRRHYLSADDSGIPTPHLPESSTGTRRNRVLSWLAEHSYRSAALHGASLGVLIGLAFAVEPLVPGLVPPRRFSLAGVAVGMLTSVLATIAFALIATAAARGLVRAYGRR
jgi:hypothetical protein